MPKKKITIDDLAKITKAGFDEARKDRKEIRNEMDDLAVITKSGFDEVDKKFEGVDKRFNEVDKRFEGIDKRFGEVEYHLKSYIDDKLADTKGDIIAAIKGDKDRDKVFKIKLLTIIKRNKLAKESELKALSGLIG